MVGWWSELDSVLRGETTRTDRLAKGRMEGSPARLAVMAFGLAMIFGLCLGTFTLWREGGPAWMQWLATTVKVPLLLGLTLIVTFPSLYVFNALVGSRLSSGTVLRLLLAGLVVLAAVLASMGPIVAFFGASTSSYPFMKLLNVAVFTIGGLLGLGFVLRTLERLSQADPAPSADPAPTTPAWGDEESPEPTPTLGPLDRLPGQIPSRHVRVVFRVWVALFAVVGAQMAWVLRPFLGAPDLPFTWFRPRGSNFFEALLRTCGELFR